MIGQNFVQPVLYFDYVAGVDVNVNRLAFGRSEQLVNHYFGIRQGKTLSFGSGREQNRRARSRDADANGGNIGLNVLNGVVNRQERRNHSSRRIYIKLDVFFWVLRLQK